MEDRDILLLYQMRNTDAIEETKKKYSALVYTIAYRILSSKEDAEECENEVYLDCWNSIPPETPDPLSAFLAMLSRRRSLDRYRKKTADKRGGTSLALTELDDCIPDGKSLDDAVDMALLRDLLNRFLHALPEEESLIFLRRYYFGDSVREIAKRFASGQSRIKMILKRGRDKLRTLLETEGFIL